MEMRQSGPRLQRRRAGCGGRTLLVAWRCHGDQRSSTRTSPRNGRPTLYARVRGSHSQESIAQKALKNALRRSVPSIACAFEAGGTTDGLVDRDVLEQLIACEHGNTRRYFSDEIRAARRILTRLNSFGISGLDPEDERALSELSL